MDAAPSCRLYLITPPRIDDPRIFAAALREALDGGDVAVLQLRLKDTTDTDIMHCADILRPICQQRDVAFILNDRPDLAAKLDCDGVHVGQEDASYAEARRLMGTQRIVGVTCHDSRHLAVEAADAGADYVAFGAFFPTGTKEAKTRAPIELLRWWRGTTNAPCVAIGGITVSNCATLVEAGADFLAVSAGIWAHAGGPGAAVSAFNAVLSRVHANGTEADRNA